MIAKRDTALLSYLYSNYRVEMFTVAKLESELEWEAGELVRAVERLRDLMGVARITFGGAMQLTDFGRRMAVAYT